MEYSFHEIPVKGLVPRCVFGKIIRGGTNATVCECVEAATIETDTREVTPKTVKTVIREVTPMVVDTLTPFTNAWVDCSCVL